jgi:hypothetical protein
MLQILKNLNLALRQSLFFVGLMLLITVSNLFVFVSPSYSVEISLTPEEKVDRAYEYSEGTGLLEEDREEAYDEALKDAKNNKTMEKAYERNLKAERAENPQPGLIEKAEELVEKITGKE